MFILHLVWYVFVEMRLFSHIVFVMISLKMWRGKTIHGRIPWAQNFQNPHKKFIIPLFDVRTRFVEFWKSCRAVVTRWSGRFGWAPVLVLVIFKVPRTRQYLRLGWVLWNPKVRCGGKGVNNGRRNRFMALDLTRPGPDGPANFQTWHLCCDFVFDYFFDLFC